MAHFTSDSVSRDARITDRTRSMFRAIFAENCIADTDDVTLEQEVVMFFKLARSHRIKLGRPGDFVHCPVTIDDDDNETTSTVYPVPRRSTPSPTPSSSTSSDSSSSSALSSLRSSPVPSPPPISSPHPLLRAASGANNHGEYAGMDAPVKRKRKRTSSGKSKNAPSEQPLARSIEDVDMDEPNESQQSVENIPHTPQSESLHADAKEAAVPDGPITKSLEGGMLEILQPEDAIDVMTSVLLMAAKIRLQAGKFGFDVVNLGITTDITKIREYTEKWLVEQPFDMAIGKIAKAGAGCVGIGLQKAWEEAFYWDIIKKYAATLEPMPTAKGPPDGFTPQEKVATSKFIDMVGNAGVVYTLLYRNAKFNKYCKTFPRNRHTPHELVDTILSWEKVYSSHIKQVELRALDRAHGDYSGRLDLRYTSVAELLTIPDSCWDNSSHTWRFDGEETSWKLTSNYIATTMESNRSRLARDAYVESGTNKSFFISLRPSIDRLISVFPIIPIAAGDLLGIFAGEIRFSEHCHIAQCIPGPASHLWLDYSQVTGTLNQMQVVPPGGEANVCLTWEGVNENVESGPCESWRVLVLANRKIEPFEPLIRAAFSDEQFRLHQSNGYARRGFLEELSKN